MPWHQLLDYAYLGSFVAFSLLRGGISIANRRHRAASPQLESRASVLFRVAVILIQAGLMTLYGFHAMFQLFQWMELFRLPFPLALRAVAGVFTIGSLLGIVWVHIALGRQFSDKLELRESHALVTTGPYRWVRHPLYSFLFLFFIASAVLSSHALIAACSALLIANIYVRIGKEEAMLQQHFGRDFDAYAQKTPRLIPSFRR
jgi:protein-S-isoprenylcysteine O-methyltransferase Ste14